MLVHVDLDYTALLVFAPLLHLEHNFPLFHSVLHHFRQV